MRTMALGLCLLLAGGPAGAASWPAFRRDAKRTGRSAEQAYPPLTLRWRFVGDGAVLSSPAVGYGKVFVGTRERLLVALDAVTGEEKWRYMARGWVDASPALGDRKAFAVSRDGVVHAVDVETGTALWTFATGSTDLASPVFADGELVVATGYPDGRVLVLDARTGALLRSAALPAFTSSSPAVDEANDRLYVGSSDGRLSALKLSDLSDLDGNPSGGPWPAATLGAMQFATPALTDDGLVVSVPAGDERRVLALSTGTAAAVWTATLSNGPVYAGSPALAAGTVVAAAGLAPVRVFGLSAATGGTAGSWPPGGVAVGNASAAGYVPSPAAVNDAAYVVSGDLGAGDHRVFALTLSSGGTLGSWTLGTSSLSSPAVANGFLYVGTQNGQLFAFQAERVTALASPDPLLEPQVFGEVPVQGYALGPDLASWTLEVGSGTAPTSWTQLSSGTAQANGELLATWDTDSLAPGAYTLRLTAAPSAANGLDQTTTAGFLVTQSTSSLLSAAQGGVVALADGTEVVVPAGALKADCTLTITRLLTGFPDTGLPGDAALTVTPIVREFTCLEDPAPTFNAPVTLRLPYSAADVPAGSDEEDLRVHLLDAGQYKRLGTSRVEAAQGRVSARVEHFSTYRVLAYVPAAGPLVQEVYTHPNPATGSLVTFKFALAEASDVKITVYNVAGDPVRELFAPSAPGGAIVELDWDVTRVASGVYLYLFEAKSATREAKAKKFLAIRH